MERIIASSQKRSENMSHILDLLLIIMLIKTNKNAFLKCNINCNEIWIYYRNGYCNLYQHSKQYILNIYFITRLILYHI